MRVIIKMPEHHWFEANVPKNVDVLQSLVGGHFEHVSVDDGLDVLCNEEGRINGMAPNTFVYIYDEPQLIYGPMIFCSHNEEDICSLDEDDMAAAIDMLTDAEKEMKDA